MFIDTAPRLPQTAVVAPARTAPAPPRRAVLIALFVNLGGIAVLVGAVLTEVIAIMAVFAGCWPALIFVAIAPAGIVAGVCTGPIGLILTVIATVGHRHHRLAARDVMVLGLMWLVTVAGLIVDALVLLNVG
ncbi:hypothetical protein AAFP35_07715 [Gordonia sp. CPCC 206044]|uniref:hypothetical protein n=1 Tax=Gordonia sp. CPCC 206044 TaxID=3140793 RepID=UPI003AF37145